MIQQPRSRRLGTVCLAFLIGLGRPLISPAFAADPPTEKAKAAEKEITAEEAKQWGADLRLAVGRQDADAFNRLLDWDALMDTVTTASGDSPKLKQIRSGFAIGLKRVSLSADRGFAHAIITNVDGTGDYRPLHVHRAGGRQRVLFRLIGVNGATNYHDFILGRLPSGKVVATDWYIFTLGELYSQFCRRGFLPVLHQLGSEATAAVSGPEKDFVSHVDEFAQMGNDLQDKKYQQLLDTYKRLPPSLQLMKPVLTMRLVAARALDSPDYLKTIDDFRKQYPNDAMVDLISIDALIIRKDYEKAFQALDRVDKMAGGDPYVKVLQAGIRARQNNPAAARELAQKAVAEEPSLLRGYYTLIEFALDGHDFDDTAKWLKQAEAHGAHFGDLSKAPVFADFVKSPQYKAWKKSHSSKG